MSAEVKTTTTTAAAEKVVDISSFLDTNRLTRAERSYYEKHLACHKGELKTISDWRKIIQFIH